MRELKKDYEPDNEIEGAETGSTGGLSAYYSWSGLNDVLKKHGELRPHEFLRGVKVDDDGITIYLATKGD